MHVEMEGYRVIYDNNIYDVLKLYPSFDLKKAESNSGRKAPEHLVNKACWLKCIVRTIDGEILMLSDEPLMFKFVKI